MSTSIKVKRISKPTMPDLKTDKDFNLKFYRQLPPGTRVGKIEDFWDYKNDNYIMKMPFLIHSEVDPGKYWALRTSLNFAERNDFWEFLRKGRVYVFDIKAMR